MAGTSKLNLQTLIQQAQLQTAVARFAFLKKVSDKKLLEKIVNS
jgi:hypothetical protein